MNTAFIRFYEELNDFLPSSKQKVTYPVTFRDNPSVKSVIESEGIPHTEVDLILINGDSAPFQEKVNHNDRISVYPVFESMDISPVNVIRLKPLRETKFVLDVHLGKLARYLRMLGFDTVFYRDLTDMDLVSISILEKRSLLTRDRRLLMRKDLERGYWIRHELVLDQVYEVFQRFDLSGSVRWFSICTLCNGKLQVVEEKKAREQLPDFIFTENAVFYQCEICHHVYWNGSHGERFKQSIDEKVLKHF